MATGHRLTATGLLHDSPGRNTYPDFSLVNTAEGFEVKGLAYPGREASYDSNSQIPVGVHNGRSIYYVFGRYPADVSESEYPLVDLIICHGNFLNSNNTYIHKNKSIKSFGSYGDIMIRDRKMYVAPTPFGLTTGTAAQRTLIVPDGSTVDDRFVEVGTLIRTETDKLVVGYHFDLVTNVLTPTTVPNPNVGIQHIFKAYRLRDDNHEQRVAMRLP